MLTQCFVWVNSFGEKGWEQIRVFSLKKERWLGSPGGGDHVEPHSQLACPLPPNHVHCWPLPIAHHPVPHPHVPFILVEVGLYDRCTRLRVGQKPALSTVLAHHTALGIGGCTWKQSPKYELLGATRILFEGSTIQHGRELLRNTGSLQECKRARSLAH